MTGILLDKLETFIKDIVSRFDEGHNFDHVLDVADFSIHFYEAFPELTSEMCSDIYTACLLHEINDGKFVKDDDIIDVAQLLRDCRPELSKERISIIIEMIEGTSYSKNGDNPIYPVWKAIPRMADRYFATGRIGIGRAMTYSEYTKRAFDNLSLPLFFSEEEILRSNHLKMMNKAYIRGERTNTTTMGHIYEKVVHIDIPTWFLDPISSSDLRGEPIKVFKMFHEARQDVLNFIICYSDLRRRVDQM